MDGGVNNIYYNNCWYEHNKQIISTDKKKNEPQAHESTYKRKITLLFELDS